MNFSKNVEFDASLSKSYSIAVGDLNSDGNKDIVIGNSNEPNVVFVNKNKGTEWEKIQLSENNFNTYDIMVFDLNGDGKLDIIESNSDERNINYFNRFKPYFP